MQGGLAWRAAEISKVLYDQVHGATQEELGRTTSHGRPGAMEELAIGLVLEVARHSQMAAWDRETCESVRLADAIMMSLVGAVVQGVQGDSVRCSKQQVK